MSGHIDHVKLDTFKSYTDERKSLFWLLARMTLTPKQAKCIFYDAERKRQKIDLSDNDILSNPYILYEKTNHLHENYRVPVKKIDYAVFPVDSIRNACPLPEISSIDSYNDKRRIRAYSIYILEQKALEGHTAYPEHMLINEINSLPLSIPCNINDDDIAQFGTFIEEQIKIISCEDRSNAYQLIRLYEMDKLIKVTVNNRVNKAKRHKISEDWRKIVDEELNDNKDDEFLERAHQEKAAVLKELAESRLSVLIGGAGTGKTTLLALLCKSKKIRDGKVLLLAPTGKARVRMKQAMQAHNVDGKAKTVAQFLIESNRFIPSTQEYCLSNEDAKDVPATVIIDESSMLTEEMFAALLQALRNAERIIFVGDPNQLPPIGAGRPFVDLVDMLDNNIPLFPKVGKSFGQLTVTMRQYSNDGSIRGDTELASWFTADNSGLDDEVFVNLEENRLGEHVLFKSFSNTDELRDIILKTIAAETSMKDEDDIVGFNISLGGYVNDKGWLQFDKNPKSVESWQILSALKSDPLIGTVTINRFIHEKYKTKEYVNLSNCSIRKTPKLLGIEGICYGDKVINIKNQKLDGYPQANSDNYVANGEVGIVEGFAEDKNKTKYHHIRFSSQPNCNYSWKSTNSDESSDDLELAYALTVHKAQGSEFDKVIIVLNEPNNILSKELLYTAITRQKDKVIIIYNEGAYRLKDYTAASNSAVARRITCLFAKPDLTLYENKYYEKSLIHRTLKGHLVRSKSELIIADKLFNAGIPYEYEQELDLGIDGKRIPDFTIEDKGLGITWYWEHCGMMGDMAYRKRWYNKKAIYEKHNIIENENLIVTEDGLDGSIDSKKIEEIITMLKEELGIF